MDIALLVYSGISVKMLVDRTFGADLVTMFTVDYEIGGAAQAHDHPFEEAYVFLAGEIEGELDGERYTFIPATRLLRGRLGPWLLERGHRAGPLDRDPGAAAARSPRLSLGPRLGAIRDQQRTKERTEPMADEGAVVVVGGTRAIGQEIARHYAATGVTVVLTGQDPANVAAAVAGVGGGTTGSPSTWRNRPRSPPPSPASDRSGASSSPRSTATRTPSPTTTSPAPSGS